MKIENRKLKKGIPLSTVRPVQRGFTLLIAVVLSSVALAIGLALLDVAYKQVILASTAKQSQTAFYAADSVLECALYADQQLNTFGYAATSGSVTCNGNNPATVTFNQSASPRTRTFTIQCVGNTGVLGSATIYKASNAATSIYAVGYNTCDSTNPRRIERGLKIVY